MPKDLLKQLMPLVEQRKTNEIKPILENAHPADIAYVINEAWQKIDQIYIFALLDEETASDVLSQLYVEVQDNILQNINDKRLIAIIDEMDTDDAADIIAELEDELTHQVLQHIEDSESVKKLMQYPDDSAGGIMQTEVISTRAGYLRRRIIEHIRNKLDDVENLHYIFVVDDYNKLIGTLDLTKLLLAEKGQTAGQLMKKDFLKVTVDTDQEQVADLFRKYDLLAVPVVDENNRLLGRITVDDIIDVIDEEALEDAYLMVGLESQDKVFTSPLSSVKKRLPWLGLNLLTALLVSTVVGVFEPTIARLSFLAVLMPIVAGLGGNSATQTLTVITRGIALGELSIRNTYKAVQKEVAVGIINGIIIGGCAAGIASTLKANPMLGMVLGLAMIANMFLASLCGALVPILLKSLKIDPALASSVIITMLTDIGGYASFLGLASVLL